MSEKHVFFYHPGCQYCQKLLSKIKGTSVQGDFLYINVLQATKLPSNLKGVPAVLPAFQHETALLQGPHAFQWTDSVLTYSSNGGKAVIRSHPDPHGVQNPREAEPDKDGHVPVIINDSSSSVTPGTKEFIGISPYEMGSNGYSDQYSFLESSDPMSHRYSYVGGHKAPGKIGAMTTKEPGDALRDSRGVTSKSKQFEADLKRLQASRDEIPNGIKRIG
jgi:hypothetical protein